MGGAVWEDYMEAELTIIDLFHHSINIPLSDMEPHCLEEEKTNSEEDFFRKIRIGRSTYLSTPFLHNDLYGYETTAKWKLDNIPFQQYIICGGGWCNMWSVRGA